MPTKLEQAIFIAGYQFYVLQQFIGMRNLKDGVEYYAEVHTSFWNSCIHTVFMPFTMLGFYISIPALWNLTPEKAAYMRRIVTLFYLGIYAKLSPVMSVVFLMYYTIPLFYSDKLYKFIYGINHNNPKISCIVIGMAISVISLIIQEVLGHYIGGDCSSRIEAVPNAIIYAQYYSIAHVFSYFHI